MNHAQEPWWWRFHLGPAPVCGAGVFTITRGPGAAARWACAAFRLPRTAAGVATRVTVTRRLLPTGAVLERWARDFDGQLLTTNQLRHDQRSEERLGPVALSLRLEVHPAGLTVNVERCWLRLGRRKWPLPPGLTPRLLAEVRSDAHLTSRFHVLVRLDAPLLGRMLTYGGHLDELETDPCP